MSVCLSVCLQWTDRQCGLSALTILTHSAHPEHALHAPIVLYIDKGFRVLCSVEMEYMHRLLHSFN